MDLCPLCASAWLRKRHIVGIRSPDGRRRTLWGLRAGAHLTYGRSPDGARGLWRACLCGRARRFDTQARPARYIGGVSPGGESMRIATRSLALAMLALAWSPGVSAADVSPVGRWWTFNDQTGAKSGIIEITLVHDELVGRIVMMIPKPGEPADFLCTQCDGSDKNQ